MGSRGRGRMVVAAVWVLLAVIVLWSARGMSVESAAEAVRSSGHVGKIVFLLAFTLIQPLGVSGHLFALAAAAVWSPWVAFALGLAGSVGAALTAFLLGRYLLYDFVRARLSPRARRFEERLANGGFVGILIVRFLSFTAHPVMYLVGVVKVPFWPMLFATVVGFAPAIALDVWIGGTLFDLMMTT